VDQGLQVGLIDGGWRGRQRRRGRGRLRRRALLAEGLEQALPLPRLVLCV
jgi:hypothetical protein